MFTFYRGILALIFRLLMNILRFVASSSQISRKYEHITPVVMIGQSKINAFFKRQCANGDDRTKIAGGVGDAVAEYMHPVKRKREESKSQVLLLKLHPLPTRTENSQAYHIRISSRDYHLHSFYPQTVEYSS